VLPETVPAVLGQEGVSEWVWVDDGSTDRTLQTLRQLIRQEPTARVVRLAANAGRAAARNRGLGETTGEIVVFFDADVRPPSGGARRLAEAARSPGAVASVGRLRPVVDQPDDPFQIYLSRHPRGPRGPMDAPTLWKHWITGLCAARRQALVDAGRFDEGLSYGEDLALACRLRAAHPDGLRLADVVVDLFDLGTLDRAIENMQAVGRVLPELADRCSGVYSLIGIDRMARSPLLPLTRVLWPLAVGRSLVRALPATVQPRLVRYLLGYSLLSAFAGVRHRPPTPG
jgi:glycosyltransferase involved in cell wall biosynthesis